MKQAIVLLTKDAVPGIVKTRLASSIGPQKACMVHELLTLHCIKVAISTNIPVVVSFLGDPNSSFARKIKKWNISLIQQPLGSLGHKIHSGLQIAQRTIVLGTDTPNISSELLLRALHSSTITIGPSFDGGYWLYAGNHPPLCLFESIPWSTASVLEKSIAQIEHLNLQYSLLPYRRDIDTHHDLLTLLSTPNISPSLKEQLKYYA